MQPAKQEAMQTIGKMPEEILQDFPTLDEKAIRAVIAFAAVSAEEDLPLPSVPTFA